MTLILKKTTEYAAALGILFMVLISPVVTLKSTTATPDWIQWTSVGISTQWPSHMRAVLLSFLSTVSRGFVSLGMFWMWPAMDLVSDCGHPPRTVWLPWGWDICWGLLAGSCVLAFDRKAVVAGGLQSVTFKTRSVTLVEGHWDPGNRRPLEENDPLWWTLWGTLWPGTAPWFPSNQSITIWTRDSAIQWLFRLSSGCWTGDCLWKEGTWLPGSLSCALSFQEHSPHSKF